MLVLSAFHCGSITRLAVLIYSFQRPTSTSHNSSRPTKLCEPLVSRCGRLIQASYACRRALLVDCCASFVSRAFVDAGRSPDWISVGTRRSRCCVDTRYCDVRSNTRSTATKRDFEQNRLSVRCPQCHGQQSTYRSAPVAKRPKVDLGMQTRGLCAVRLLRAGCVASRLLWSTWPAPCSVKSRLTRRVSCLLASETVVQQLGA